MSTIAIVVDGVDQTADVVFDRSTFDTSMNAAPGSFDIFIRDPNRTKSFTTGREISLTIDGIVMFGGYVTQVSMVHFAPAADTHNLSTYDLRAWNLRGTDYNIIFDRRFWRNTADYTSSIQLTSHFDGPQLIQAITDFSDCGDFSTAGIDSNADTITPTILQQGSTLRKDFETFSYFGGTVWYINGAKVFIYVPFETVTKSWGFSDQPSPPTSIGFRSVEGTEDGSYIENDVIIWGGSQFAGAAGGTVYARVQDATSQSTYGRWQYAETHFGEEKFHSTGQVTAVATQIVEGPPGADVYGQQKGLRYTQWQFTFTWFSGDVPGLDHVVAGDIMQIDMNAFGVSKLLPLRSLHIGFPDGFDPVSGTHEVEFQGTFGLQVSDPFTLWAYLLRQQVRLATTQINPGAVNNSSTTATFGGLYQDAPSPTPDGATTLFSIPFGYIANTLQVYQGTTGIAGAGLLRPGVDFTETSPDNGTFTMAVAPPNTAFLIVVCYTIES